jgi:hypothetical protein
VRAWQARWHEWRGEGEVAWVERRWSSVGTQRLPDSVIFGGPTQVTRWLGEADRWQRAEHRYTLLLKRWPSLAENVTAHFDVLADYLDDDFRRLLAILEWLESHPNDDLYVRQLPIEGVDTKWLLVRKSLVASLLRVIRGESDNNKDFYALAGIRQEPVLIRVRLLDVDLRRVTGGLEDITAPVEDLARLRLPLRRVYIVENLQTGLAFEDLPSAAVFMRLGYAVDLFGEISWLREVPCFYWGDLDTHGFAILDRLRRYLPHTQSLLMDETTLLDHQYLWGEENKPVDGATLPFLTPAEHKLYTDLCNHRWRPRLRLEQERIPWKYAWSRVCATAMP